MKYLILTIAFLQLGSVSAQIDVGMVAHFPFNGNYDDISSTPIIGTNLGTVFGPDRNLAPDMAIELNGNEYVTFINDSVKPQFPLTLSVWVKFNSFNAFNNIFSSDSEFGNYSGYWLQTLPSTGQPAISFGDGLGGTNPSFRRSYISNTNLQIGVWYSLIAIIRAHDDMDIYIDCVQSTGIYDGTGSTTIAYFPSASRIGSSPGNSGNPNGGFYDGSIDQLVIWNRELTISEIAFMCDKENTLTVPEISQKPKELVKVVNVMGQETLPAKNMLLFYIYNDGSIERIYTID